jgi:hypothetical protein
VAQAEDAAPDVIIQVREEAVIGLVDYSYWRLMRWPQPGTFTHIEWIG